MPTGVYKRHPHQGFQKGHKVRVGMKHSEETKKKMSQSHRHYQTEETKQKISKKLKGSKNSLGYKHPKQFGEEISKRNKKFGKKPPHPKGNEHPNWKGGISKEPYSFNFNKELKLLIRKRDNYSCQKCGIKENGRAFVPHHIDYNKKNSNLMNLILLCTGCNTKVNFNREYWKSYFQNKIMQEGGEK